MVSSFRLETHRLSTVAVWDCIHGRRMLQQGFMQAAMKAHLRIHTGLFPFQEYPGLPKALNSGKILKSFWVSYFN